MLLQELLVLHKKMGTTQFYSPNNALTVGPLSKLADETRLCSVLDTSEGWGCCTEGLGEAGEVGSWEALTV